MRLSFGMVLAACHRIKPAGRRGSLRDAARECKRRAAVPKSGGYHHRARRRDRSRAQAPDLVTMC